MAPQQIDADDAAQSPTVHSRKMNNLVSLLLLHWWVVEVVGVYRCAVVHVYE